MKKSTFANKIQDLREERDWSKTTVAKKLDNTPLSSYANWEYGSRVPDFDTIMKIADLYEVNILYLLLDDEEYKIRTKESSTDFFDSINDPSLRRWFNDLKESPEEDLKKLKSMWELINDK